MLSFPNISPEIFAFGPIDLGPISLPEIALRWYGMMYVIGYVIGFHIFKARIRKGFANVPVERADGYITYLVVGMLLGARLVYVFVYNWSHYSLHPGEIFALWSGGLSFHGAMLGMIVSSWIYANRNGLTMHSMLDNLGIGAAPALFFGRIGNFINGELYGRPTDSWVGMVFPTDPEKLPRFPSQIFQGLTEGLLLFLILCAVQKYFLKRGQLKHGLIGGVFVFGYGFFRFIVEYTRQPDPQLGYLAGGLTMGQILCALMMIASVFQILHVVKTQKVYSLKSDEDLAKELSKIDEKIDSIDQRLKASKESGGSTSKKEKKELDRLEDELLIWKQRRRNFVEKGLAAFVA